MKTRVMTLQFAFFLKDIVDRPDLEFSDLNRAMLNTFDAIPQIIPVPRELPPEVPIMVLRSDSGDYVCNISRSRIDFMVNRLGDEKNNSETTKDFNAKVSGLSKYILEKQDAIRFGMVARYFCHDNSAVLTLRKKFFSSVVDGAEELGLRYNKKTDSHGFRINDILEISSAGLALNNSIEKGILIQRDINNDPINGKILTYGTLSELSQKFSSKISESEIEGLLK